MKTALYLRVSDPDKGQTTDNQLAQLKEWCDHKGRETTEVYRDDESGRRGRAERSADDSAHAEIDRSAIFYDSKNQLQVVAVLTRGGDYEVLTRKDLEDDGQRFKIFREGD